MPGTVTYRMVAGPVDAEPAAKFLANEGHYVPNAHTSLYWIAERDGEIIAAVALVLTPVVESFTANESSVARELFRTAQSWIEGSGIKRVYMHTAHPAMKAMIKRADGEPVSEEFFLWARPSLVEVESCA